MRLSTAGGNLFGHTSFFRSPFARREESFREAVARLSFLVLLIIGIATLLVALVMVAREAYPALFAGSGLWGLLIADPWEPLSQPARLGLRHAWVSTLVVTAIALAFAVPLGFGIGIFIAEIAPATIKKNAATMPGVAGRHSIRGLRFFRLCHLGSLV